MTADCVFCRVLAGDLPGSFVYRDDQLAAFMDIQPVNEGHVLVVPARHAAYLTDLTPDECAHLMRVAQRIAAALRASGIRCEGINLLLGDGEAAMQEVFHAHLHVLPRYQGDGFGFRFAADYYTSRPSREQLDAAAASVRAQLPAQP